MPRVWLFAALLVVCAGCREEPPACIAAPDQACAPQYMPTFTNVYSNTLSMDCGSQDGSCHSAAGEGGISFATIDDAYSALTAGRIKQGDAACSELIVRTHDHDHDYSMPPDSPLSDPELCALRQWVAMGAPR